MKRFSQSIHTDERVNAVLSHCTKCSTALPVPQTVTAERDGMLLLSQCPKCRTVFVMDWMSPIRESA